MLSGRSIVPLCNRSIPDVMCFRSCVELFESMGMGTLDSYVADLEDPLLVNTREHYARKSQEWIETDSTPDYMIKVLHDAVLWV